MTAVKGFYESSPTSVVTGKYKTVAIDQYGNQKAAEQFAPVYEDNTAGVAAVANKPLAVSTYTLTNVTSTAAEQSRLAKTGSGVLYFVSVANKNAAVQYLWVFDAVTATGSPLVVPLAVPAGGNATLDLTSFGVAFATGCTVALSSTFMTYTAGGTDAMFTVGLK